MGPNESRRQELLITVPIMVPLISQPVDFHHENHVSIGNKKACVPKKLMRCRGIIHRVIMMFDALDKAQALLAEKLEPIELREISRQNKKWFVFQETFTQILVDIP